MCSAPAHPRSFGDIKVVLLLFGTSDVIEQLAGNKRHPPRAEPFRMEQKDSRILIQLLPSHPSSAHQHYEVRIDILFVSFLPVHHQTIRTRKTL